MTLEKDFTQDVIDRIKKYQVVDKMEEVGTVSYIGDGIAFCKGLDQAMYGEMVEFMDGTIGMVQNLEDNQVGIIIFGSYEHIHEGDIVHRLYKTMEVPVGSALLGRVVDSLGRPIDDLGPIESTSFRPVEAPAPGIMERQSVKNPYRLGLRPLTPLYRLVEDKGNSLLVTEKLGKHP